MSWLSAIGTTLYYLTLPLTTLAIWIFNSALVALGPVFHLGNHILSTLLLPLRLIAKFETLYIYLGVAAIIGLITGSILHFSSSVLVSVFNLTPPPYEAGRSTASFRAAREQKKLDEAWTTSRKKAPSRKPDISLEKKYAEWIEKESGKRREDQGLFRQTILEEDDDSEDF